MNISPHRTAQSASPGPDGYQNPFVLRAIRACADSQSELARRIGGRCRQGHVSKWLKMRRLSVEACVWLRDATRHTTDPLCLRQMLTEQVRLVERVGRVERRPEEPGEGR